MRRPRFADDLRRNARHWGLERAETIEFAFRRRYALPPTDARYLDCPVEEIVVDYWAHRHVDDPKLRHEIVNEDFDEDLAEFEREHGVEPEPAPLAPDEWEEVLTDTFGATPR